MRVEIPGSKIPSLIKEFEDFPVDRAAMPQGKLDLDERSRKSLFRWSGQFPPELAENLLGMYANAKSTVLDPFVGSGTMLIEAARRSLSCTGAEINPAAAELAKTALFCNIKKTERKKYLDAAWKSIEKNIKESNSFDYNMKNMLTEALNRPLVYNILVNALMRASTMKDKDPTGGLVAAFNLHKSIVNALPYSPRRCSVLHADARSLPTKSGSVDLVITSPPYIGIFDYSKNYKRAMWFAGWKQSDTVKHEIGSNKKNLHNRFLVLVQYAIDMCLALREIRRVLKRDGRAVILIGREARVRDVSFGNSALLYALAVGACGFRMALRQERQFTGRSGEKIHEDLLHLVPAETGTAMNEDFPREVANYFLRAALKEAKDVVHEDIAEAINGSYQVQPSAILKE